MAYKNPPKKMRFRPGVSGNPLGRPASIPDSDVLYLVRAFATAWRYRTAYEKHGDLEYVIKSEQTSWRSLYRYLNLAYMHPEKANNILSGKEPCSMTEIFAMAPKHQI